MRGLLAVLGLVLATGCSQLSPLAMDNAVGTLPVPNPQTDCQIRRGNANVAGSGMAVGGNAGGEVLSVIGVANCPPGLLQRELGLPDARLIEEVQRLRQELDRLRVTVEGG